MMLSVASRRAAVVGAARRSSNKLSSSSLRTAAIATNYDNCNQHQLKNHEQQQTAWFSSFNEPTTLFPAISSANETGDDAMLRSDVRTMVCRFYIFDV